jgi:hypothetical protein
VSFGDQLGVAGLVMSFLGIGITILWPGQRWIGWTCIGVAALLLFGWASVEITEKFERKLPSAVATQPSTTVQPRANPATDKQATPKANPKPHTLPPHLEVGLILGADKGMGIDAIVDCKKPIYTCLSEAEVRHTRLVFDVGAKAWARLIFQVNNIGGSKLLNSVTHIESPNPISIEFAPHPDASRLPRNVLDLRTADIFPFSIAQSGLDIPLDIVVPVGVGDFDLNVNTFGDNMVSEKRNYHFEVKR